MRIVCPASSKARPAPAARMAIAALSFTLLALLVLPSESAAEQPALDMGIMELGGSLAADWQDDFNSLEISPLFGMYVAPGAQIEVRPIISRVDFAGTSAWEFWLLGMFDYNIETNSPAVPFIGGGAGFVRTGGDHVESSTDFVISGGGGVKVFLTDRAFIRAEYLLRNVFIGDDDIRMNNILFGFGVMIDDPLQ